ncbi:hypothetical protein Leryth_010873 [Lithospermum erythrorhizon]|nr:hypothetical protein Leryth_010873 [Lithospermum erythrorhizon]
MFLRQIFSKASGPVDSIGKSKICNIVQSSLIGKFGVISTSEKVNANIPLQWAFGFEKFIHSGSAKEFEAAGDSRRPEIDRSTVDPNMNNVLNLLDRNAGIGMNRGWNPRNAGIGRSTVDPNLNSLANSGSANIGGLDLERSEFKQLYNFLPGVNIEKDADIVHIKMLKNNTFVTVTDSNGNKKFGASAGKLTDKGGKISRYAAEAIAEQIGRDARGRGIKSVVVKVNGFMYFKKKRQAILSFKEGYSHSRRDKNPVVYIEDTTRRPHNGCRLRKQRRV